MNQVRQKKTMLTKREREILKHLAQGKKAKEIASCLHISARTVEVHKKNIYTKYGVHSSNQLLSLMIEIIVHDQSTSKTGIYKTSKI